MAKQIYKARISSSCKQRGLASVDYQARIVHKRKRFFCEFPTGRINILFEHDLQ